MNKKIIFSIWVLSVVIVVLGFLFFYWAAFGCPKLEGAFSECVNRRSILSLFLVVMGVVGIVFSMIKYRVVK